MFGSLMMFASGRIASWPSSASASSVPLLVGEHVGELRDDPAGQRDVAGLDLDARLGGVRLDDRQERVRRQQRRLVGVGVDDRGHGCGRSCAAAVSTRQCLDVKIPDVAGTSAPGQPRTATNGQGRRKRPRRCRTRLRPWPTPPPPSRRSPPRLSGPSSSSSSAAAPPSHSGGDYVAIGLAFGLTVLAGAYAVRPGLRCPLQPRRLGRAPRSAAGWPGAGPGLRRRPARRRHRRRPRRCSSWCRASTATTSATRPRPEQLRRPEAAATPGGRRSCSS